MAEGIYSAEDIVDKTLFALKDLPYYDSVPSSYSAPRVIGVIDAGTPAGQVYSWIDANPVQNRDVLWWQFYPSGFSSQYFYMPHHKGDFDMQALAAQGVLSEEEKRAAEAEANKTWYEKLFDRVIPVAAIVILGAAVIRGYFSKKPDPGQ